MKVKFLDNGPIRFSVENDDESIKDVLFNEKNKPITIKKNSILCRCGRSKQQPFCDGVHRMSGFSTSDEIEGIEDIVKMSFSKKGPFEVMKVDKTKLRLCRCGASKDKQFCDDAHLEITSKRYTF